MTVLLWVTLIIYALMVVFTDDLVGAVQLSKSGKKWEHLETSKKAASYIFSVMIFLEITLAFFLVRVFFQGAIVIVGLSLILILVSRVTKNIHSKKGLFLFGFYFKIMVIFWIYGVV